MAIILFVVLVRIILPLSIFRYPLFGALLAFQLDAVDWHVLQFTHSPYIPLYQEIDKVLDFYYIALEACVMLRFKNTLVQKTGVLLFLYRSVGVALFELTRNRIYLFMFPNLFENFYLFYVIYTKLAKKEPSLTIRNTPLLLFILLIPKFIQEYYLHYQQLTRWNWFSF